MEDLFTGIALTNVRRAVFRNIVSIHHSQDLFDDLSTDPVHQTIAQRLEIETKPASYRSTTPIIHRPFEDVEWTNFWFNVIGYPFKNWQSSRFSDGSFGVWYGSDAVETTVHETVHHWVHGLLRDAGFMTPGSAPIVAERKVYQVDVHAALLNLVPLAKGHPQLVDKVDYTYTQALGAKVHREGHPGLLTASARHAGGVNQAIFNPAVLSNPKPHCQLSYSLEGELVTVSREAKKAWLKVPLSAA